MKCSPRPRRKATKKEESSSSESSDSDDGGVHPQQDVAHDKSFSSDAVADTPVIQSKSRGTARMQCATMKCSPRLRRKATKKEESSSSESSDNPYLVPGLREGFVFHAGDKNAAKNFLLAKFKQSHVNGHIVCNNSR
jgi:hypothetical protein